MASAAAEAEAKPRVVVLVTLSEVGGAQTYVARLVELLTPSHDVVVAAEGQGSLAAAVRTAGARYVELVHMRRRLSPWHDLLALLELVRLLRRERPRVVHANSSKAGILGRLAAFVVRVPSRVFTVHGWAFNAHSGLAARIYLLAERLVAPLTTLTICVAESEFRDGVDARVCAAARTVVCPNAVPLSPIAPRPVNDPPIVLTVGRLKRPKDFSTLLQAVALLRRGSCRLLVAGDGPERDQLVAEARSLGIDGGVEFLGERDDIPTLLGACDVFVLSSRSEGMPMSVLEAMAAEMPVVATAVGGVPEVVGEEAGSLVPAADAAALAAALARLLDDRPLRERLGQAGRARVERRFGLEEWGRTHLQLYENELRHSGARGSSTKELTESASAVDTSPMLTRGARDGRPR